MMIVINMYLNLLIYLFLESVQIYFEELYASATQGMY